MECNECGNEEDYIPSKTATGLICSRCVSKMVAPPDPPKSVTKANSASPEEKAAKAAEKEKKKAEKLEKMKTRGRGKGWHLKRLFEYDGKFYSFGKEIDANSALKIKKEIKENPDLDKPAPKKVRRKKS